MAPWAKTSSSSSFGVLAFIFTFMLKLEDRKKGYGLELPEVKKETE